jgi:hypothetical protein
VVGLIEGDGFINSGGKDLDLNEFSDLAACAGWGIVCFSVSDNCARSGLDDFAGSPNARGRELV